MNGPPGSLRRFSDTIKRELTHQLVTQVNPLLKEVKKDRKKNKSKN